MIESFTPEDLRDQMWRLKHLYKCKKQGSGEAIPFYPRPEQRAIFQRLIDNPTDLIIIIKSRRLGLSTGLNIFQVDSSVFNHGWTGELIDRTENDAKKKMDNQIQFAFNNMHPLIRQSYQGLSESKKEFSVIARGESKTEKSSIYASVSARGGDCSMLHISEMGPIAAMDDQRAQEIVSGAMPAASQGRTVIETTWMGGKKGELWELVEPILRNDPNAKGVIYFFPWHDDPEAIETEGSITKETEEYFKQLESKLGKRFNQEQKKWYAAKKVKYRHATKREYPSTLAEAFAAPIKGAIYAPYLDEAEAEQRITNFPVDRSALVHTAWDLGTPFNTVTWFFQMIGQEIRIVDCMLEKNLTPVDRVAAINAKGYPLGVHLFPHDGKRDTDTGESIADKFTQAGLSNIRIVPRTKSVWVGINATEEAFPRFLFHRANTEKGRERLVNYRVDNESSTGKAIETPVHDRNSHAADALRMIKEGETAGLIRATVGNRGGRRLKANITTIKDSAPRRSGRGPTVIRPGA
jgi:hypothetical protein